MVQNAILFFTVRTLLAVGVPSLLWEVVESFPKQTSWNSITNIRKLIKEQNDLLGMTYGASNYLTKFQGCIAERGLETRGDYLFSIEGQDLTLNCGRCTPPSKRVYWRWITFEGVESPLSQEKKDDDIFQPIRYYQTEFQELVLVSPKPDLSTFYCYWEDTNILDESVIRVIQKIWTVEIVSVAHMETISARSWRKNSSKAVKRKWASRDLDIGIFNTKIRVGTEWSRWSPCSKCGVAGKRYKIGFCSVDKVFQEYDSGLEVLNYYKLPISCSMLIDFHPELVSDSTLLKNFSQLNDLNRVLGRSHTILIGYCRSKRNCVPEGDSGNKMLSQLFESFEMVGDGKDMGQVEESWSARRLLWVMKSLTHGIPFGWDNLPEIVVLIGLIAIQVYVIYLVLRWRGDAR